MSASCSVGSWEQLVSITFDAGVNSIVLESEEGRCVTIPCEDLAELRRLAKISYALADGHSVKFDWRIPVLSSSEVG